MKGFKQFILRGNVLDLAVADIMGGAFSATASKPSATSAAILRVLIVGSGWFGVLAMLSAAEVPGDLAARAG